MSIKHLTAIIISVSLSVIVLSCGNGTVTSAGSVAGQDGSGYIVSAYVWPSCHDDSLAHKWLWEDGEGEWEVIKKGDPRFPGHYQPKQPLWGYGLDDDPQVVEKWITTALKYGVNTFCYDWYWYKTEDGYNGPYLESALDNGFLGAPSNEKMNFWIMWANHNVVYNYWNYHKWGDRKDLLFDPKVGWDEFRIIVGRIITKYFSRPNYLKFKGCPVIGIFDVANFIAGFGDEGEARKAVAYFRDEVRKAGFDGLYLMGMTGGGYSLNENNLQAISKRRDIMGFDGYAFYNMGGIDEDYLKYCAASVEIRKQWDETFTDIPVYPCVSIGWDDTPRFPEKKMHDLVHYNNTPTVFGSYVKLAKDYADAHPDQPKFITINAWNEWIEGSYLLPDKLNGYGYLQAVRDALDGKYD